MAEGLNKAFFADLIDDYYAECDEHIASIRRALLKVEAADDNVDLTAINDIMRAFHTVKGLSSMVGVVQAEMLSHHLENYLRRLARNEAELSVEGIESILDAAGKLEQIISAHRHAKPAPDIKAIIQSIKQLSENSQAAGPPESQPSAAAIAGNGRPLQRTSSAPAELCKNGKRTWKFTFRPDKELAARGVNVSSVRTRLQQVGEIKSAAPLVSSDGGVAFEFEVVAAASEGAFAGWKEDGLSWVDITPQGMPAAVVAAEQQRADALSAPATPLTIAPSNVVRVDLDRLDDLMRMVGEMVISRARLEENLKQVEGLLPASALRPLQETSSSMGRQLRDLREGIMRVRMVPIGETFERMQFAIRELAREHKKRVRVEIGGEETQVDKLIVERMLDPLLHLVRNAVSHGLEDREERLRCGKPEQSTISLSASTEGDAVLIEIADDGRGIDSPKIRERAEQLGLVRPGENLEAAAILQVITESGFSTRDEADLTSGRGVGMAVVLKTVQELGGRLTLDNRPGLGTRFIMQLPLTLAIIDALIVSAGGEKFAAPLQAVREVIQIDAGAVTQLEGNQIIPYRTGILPIVHLAEHYRLARSSQAKLCILVVGAEAGLAGIAVDRVLGQKEIVVRPLSDELIKVVGFAGATELGDGRAVLILDAHAMVRSSIARKNQKK